MELNSIDNILDKVSSTLNFFDFSFIVSGFATFFTLLLTVQYHANFTLPKDKLTLAIFAIVLIYISGILSYSAGKFLRKKWSEDNFEEDFKNTIKIENKLQKLRNNGSVQINIEGVDNVDFKQLYDQMWIHLRHDKEGCKTVNYLNRSVMMQSICEGLFFSSIVAFFCSISLMIHSHNFYFILISLCSILFWKFFSIEAQRCSKIQRRQVVGAYFIFILEKERNTNGAH